MYQGGKIFKLEVVAKIKTRSTKERERDIEMAYIAKSVFKK